MLILFSKIFIYTTLFLSTVAALGVVLLPNIFHSALCLVATLLGVAILYLALGAEFIAVVQILLYVGAVMTLIIFAIMLTQRLAAKAIPQANKQSLPAALTVLAFTGFVINLILKTSWPAGAGLPRPYDAARVDTFKLGEALLGTYVFPFEVVSIVLIAALVGAVVIARKD